MEELQRSKKVAEVCLELLTSEAVRCFEEREHGPAASASLEATGMHVGRQLVERLTKDKPRLGDTLEVIKYLCKDFWMFVFGKQVDNLRTNHRGVYVLQDNSFRWLQRFAAAPSGDPVLAAEAHRMALSHLHLPCGIIRGALCHLGVPCTVEASEAKVLPACAFTIRVVPA